MNPDLPTETAYTPKSPSLDLKPPTVEIVPTNKPATIVHSDVQPIKRKIGDYSVIRELGRGGMGVVYLARQESLNRHVALKVIPAGPDASPSDLKRFRLEAETAAALTHPNIVSIYDTGEADGVAYVAMEYVPGGTLHDQIYKNPLPPSDAAAIVESLARAVECAHEKGIIHRDIKPSNILLSPKGEPCRDKSDLPWIPKVADFGLAKKIDTPAITGTNVVMGTPNYMSPEQAQGLQQRVGPSTDIYALGAVLYEALTGYPPFNGETSYEIIQHVVRTPPTRPTHLRVGIPSSIETVCLKALEKDPKKRFSTAKELADNLAQTFHEQQPPTVRSSFVDLPIPLETPKQPVFRGRWLLVLACAVLLLIVGVGILSRGLSNARKENLDLQSQIGAKVSERDLAAQSLFRAQLREILLECEQGDPTAYVRLRDYIPYNAIPVWKTMLEKNRQEWLLQVLEPVAGTPKESSNPDGFDSLPKKEAKPALTVIHPKAKLTATLMDKKVIVIIPPGKEMDNLTRHPCPEDIREIHWCPNENHLRLLVLAQSGKAYSFDPSLPSWSQIPEPDAVTTVGFSLDGNLFGLGTDRGTITLWDCVTLQRMSFPVRVSGSVEWFRWNKNQTLLGYQTSTHSGLLMCRNPFDRGSILASDPLVGLEWGPSGKLYLTQNRNATVLGEGETTPTKIPQERGMITDAVPLKAIKKDPESLLLATREKQIYRLDPALGKNLQILPDRLFEKAKSLERIYLHQREGFALVQGPANDVAPKQVFYVLELEQPKLKVRYLKNLSELNPVCVTLDPSQNWAYIVLPSGEILTWNLDLDEKITRVTIQIDVSVLAVDPTGKFLAMGYSDGRISVLNLETKATRWEARHKGRVNVLLWNGGNLFSGSTDQTVRVWEGETGIALGPIRHHLHAVTKLSLQGKKLAVGGAEGDVRVWALP